MNKIAIAVHGGAGPDSDHIRENQAEYEKGLEEALEAGYKVLHRGGSALNAVEDAVKSLEDNELFNAGRGSAMNNKGEVEMDAAIMDGEKMKAGAVSMVKNVKNPVALARFIMKQTSHVLLSGAGALELAKKSNIELEADAYFITTKQYDAFIEKRDKESIYEVLYKKVHGTVGAVARDVKGNLAAATSSGGTTNSLNGRIGDSCIIGAGCYANNRTCAVSGTGEGERLIIGVLAHTVSSVLEYKGMKIQEACDFVIHEVHAGIKDDLGLVSIDAEGQFGISFNSERMHRAWKGDQQPLQIMIYKI